LALKGVELESFTDDGMMKKLENKHPEHIKYHGYVSNEKMPEIYKKNDVIFFSKKTISKSNYGRVNGKFNDFEQ